METTTLLDDLRHADLVESGGRSLANLGPVRDQAQKQFAGGIAIGHDARIEAARPQPCGRTIDRTWVAHQREFVVDRQALDRLVPSHCHWYVDLLDLKSSS